MYAKHLYKTLYSFFQFLLKNLLNSKIPSENSRISGENSRIGSENQVLDKLNVVDKLNSDPLNNEIDEQKAGKHV